MAKFRKGQRVRIVRASGKQHDARTVAWFAKHGDPIGKTATVMGPAQTLVADYSVLIDDFPPGPGDGTYAAMEYQLEPLVDRKAEAFIRAMKKLKPLHEEPKVERETAKQLLATGGSSE